MWLFDMDKKQVIAESRKYMQGILQKVNAIPTIKNMIEDMGNELALNTAPNVAPYGVSNKSAYAGDKSPTSSKAERHEYLRAAILRERAKLGRMELDILNARTSICHKFTMSMHVREWMVLEALYFDGLSQQQTALKMKCSGAMVSIINKKALLSVGSAVLGMQADGEYYEDNGMYIDFTPAQKKRIQEGITLV
ncbi:hypothetical protein NZ47_13550 [Anaerovibrio lipolyticus]|uniref:Uncharacterized protein n=2 Tax=Anaerovibrio lipolyticus TaxID=82374 RepID=A0A0B2JNI1_9FIRM|nr:hypothetical protein NZ47_13550 [Anaerovibrio lipolyticus]